jgi:hypothetical protein
MRLWKLWAGEEDVAPSMTGVNRYRYIKVEYQCEMQSIKFTYPLCKFGFEYAFHHRDKNIREWRSVQNMHSFNADIVTTLWEEKVQTIRFTVSLYLYMYVCLYVCMYVCMYVCVYIYIYIYIYIYMKMA